MAKKDGGPAFPTDEGVVALSQLGTTHYEGMTLRDYFAGQVIVSTTVAGNSKYIAKYAYETADAMIEARDA